jgi:hypothetical protein
MTDLESKATRRVFVKRWKKREILALPNKFNGILKLKILANQMPRAAAPGVRACGYSGRGIRRKIKKIKSYGVSRVHIIKVLAQRIHYHKISLDLVSTGTYL